MKIYGDRGSGNCQKVSITADYLKIPYQWVDIDIMKNESRSEAFLKMYQYRDRVDPETRNHRSGRNTFAGE